MMLSMVISTRAGDAAFAAGAGRLWADGEAIERRAANAAAIPTLNRFVNV
jgi:hypothetical protein